MFENSTDVGVPETAESAAAAAPRAPSDTEAAALVGDLQEASVISDAHRDTEALRASPDAPEPGDTGDVRIPRQHGEPDRASRNGKAAVAAGTLSLHDVTPRNDPETAPSSAHDRTNGAQARYEMGMMPLSVGARARAARMAGDAAARLHRHHVDAATGEAWHMLGQQPNGSNADLPMGMVARIAERTGGSLESADAGLMRATLLRLNATTNETRTSSRGQGTDEHLGGAQQIETADAAPDKAALTLQANQLQHELTRTDRPLTATRRAELQAAHDQTLGQLRDQMRAEHHAVREATSADLRAYFENTDQDPETVIGHMLARAEQADDGTPDGRSSRDEFGAMALASYAGLHGLSPVSNFPDHAPSDLDLLAIDAADKVHVYVRLVARHGLDSQRAATALDAAFEADRAYATALNQAIAAEYATRGDSPSAADPLEINQIGK